MVQLCFLALMYISIVLTAACGDHDAVAGHHHIEVVPHHISIHQNSAVAKASLHVNLSTGRHVLYLRNVTSSIRRNSTEEDSLQVNVPIELGGNVLVERVLWQDVQVDADGAAEMCRNLTAKKNCSARAH
eukprot:PhM_4_TR11637/c0_g1_i2/m.40358